MKKYFLILIIPFFAFAFTGNPPSGWYEQTLPNIGGRPIADMFFLDSLTGWIVTPYQQQNDTAYVLKTTNGGDNWFIANLRIGQFVGHNRIQFLNSVTGYICGASDFGDYSGLNKSTDGGLNWFDINIPDPFAGYDDMLILNEDTIWLVNDNPVEGGIYRTTNGGLNWTHQLNAGGSNPGNIYMVNNDTGFAGRQARLFRTTNSGINWTLMNGEEGFVDMHFINNSTGWKSSGDFYKTTNGGSNWELISLPPKGGNIVFSQIGEFQVINEDTIWGVGSVFITPAGLRGVIYITTDGGQTWGYQLPDTSIHSGTYRHIEFVDKSKGWAYWTVGGVHTVNGGDTTILLGVEQIGSEVPSEYQLYQNYPNPFNPATNIKFNIRGLRNVKLSVFDITGKEVAILVNERLTPGKYEYQFDGSDLTSGVYFYQLKTEEFIETKKMMLIK